MAGLRFRGSSDLPRRGVVRVRNEDGVPHIAIGFPLRRGVTAKRLGRALHSNDERVFGRVLAGAPYSLHNGLSGGGTDNRQEVSFPRRGRYGLVCFLGRHHEHGMYCVVAVR